MRSTLHLPASEAYKMVGLRDASPFHLPPPAPQITPAPAAARRPSEISVVRRLTGHTVA
jgi:hypothetical protein